MSTNTLTVWDTQSNVDLLVKLYGEGKSFAQIAAAIPGATRNACIGKAKRMKLPPRADRYAQSRHTSSRARTINGEIPRKGNSGAPGQAKGNVIVHRIEGRLKAERARQAGKLAHIGNEPHRAGSLPEDDGVDATHLIAFASRKIGKECAWIPGDPLDGAMCCGKPVKPGSEWCEEHWARVYSGRQEL